MAFEMERTETPFFTPRTLELLENYPWPGNIRELKNVVERAVYRSDDAEIREIVFDPFVKLQMSRDETDASNALPDPKAAAMDALVSMPLQEAVRELKVRMLNRALKLARHNQKKAAEILGLTYHQFRGLYRNLKDRIQ
jgi:psp operon transcriptional activator